MCDNPWHCTNPEPHEGGNTGRGCVHESASADYKAAPREDAL